jgi:hypothetical protein
VEKNPLANAGHTGVGDTQVQYLGQEDPLEKEMTTHSSILFFFLMEKLWASTLAL